MSFLDYVAVLNLTYRRWLVKYHPDKRQGLSKGEKDIASFIIREYGQVLLHPNKVLVREYIWKTWAYETRGLGSGHHRILVRVGKVGQLV